MQEFIKKTLDQFWVIGIDFRELNASERGIYALQPSLYQTYLEQATTISNTETFLLSTCNRTIIIGYTPHIDQLVSLYLNLIQVSQNQYESVATYKQGQQAIEHLMRIATGLDSQILGDYEIVGQLKTAFNQAKAIGTIDLFLERTFATTLQAARTVRSKTQLSSGSVSVAHAAALYAIEQSKKLSKILLIGAGKIGRNTALNIKTIAPHSQITVSNRTRERAEVLAQEVTGHVLDYITLQSHLTEYDIIITATQATSYIVTEELLHSDKIYTLIDLSIPYNIDPALVSMNNVHYANVDILSQQNDATLKRRAQEIPKAEQYIQEHLAEFIDWLKMRKYVPVLRSIKEKIQHFNTHNEDVITKDNASQVKHAINTIAQKLKEPKLPKPGCHYIETFASYVNNSTNNFKK